MSDQMAEDSYRVLAASLTAAAAMSTPPPVQHVPAPDPALGMDALPGGHLATRPTWNPAEEARQRAAAQAALLEEPAGPELGKKHRKQIEAPVFSTSPAAARRAADTVTGKHHHTMVPRTMVLAALLAGFASPLLLIILKQQGHFELTGTTWTIDDRGRTLVVGSAVGTALCCVTGWIWWTVAAAMNARNRSRYTVSPWFAPTSLLVATACAVMLPTAAKHRSNTEVAALAGITGLAVLIAHFGVLGAYRKAAGAISAAQRPWTVLIVLPWASAAFDLVARFFMGLVGTKLVGVIGPTYLLIFGLYMISLYRAMSSFDRACAGRQMAHHDRDGLPDFLKRRG